MYTYHPQAYFHHAIGYQISDCSAWREATNPDLLRGVDGLELRHVLLTSPVVEGKIMVFLPLKYHPGPWWREFLTGRYG